MCLPSIMDRLKDTEVHTLNSLKRWALFKDFKGL
ncbi:rCG31972 [Rattus norvegicus]|uniref:RCG31972 n=1 Tax=Rattus norvegicus TaxID=10116 RepID=A6KDS2_RAT|nr:rCG31972 [Rattus norvegicus]